MGDDRMDGLDAPATVRPYQHHLRQRLADSEKAISDARVRIIRLANGNGGGLVEALDSLVAKVREDERLRRDD